MDIQERYDELDNIISSLNLLIDEITDRDYIDQLREIKYQAENEIEEVEKQLRAEQEKEYKGINYQYERSVI